MTKKRREKLEKLEGLAPFDPDIFRSDFEYHIIEWCNSHNLDPYTMTTNQFNSMLIDLNKILINKDNLKVDNYDIKNGYIKTNNNKYNYDYLLDIYNIYSYYCKLYNKYITLEGYLYISGISRQYIYNVCKELTSKGIEIDKNIVELVKQDKNTMVLNKLYDSNQGVSNIAVVNNDRDLMIARAQDKQDVNRALNASELPRLGSTFDKL